MGTSTVRSLPLLLNVDRSKLSKRQDASSLRWYREQGFEREAILTYIAALGWSPTGERDTFHSMEDLISQFSLEGVSKSGAIVDLKKLYSINSEYLNLLSVNNTEKLVEKFVTVMNNHLNTNILDTHTVEYISAVVKLCASRMRIVQEFDRIAYFFTEPDYQSNDSVLMKEKVWKERSGEWISMTVSQLENLSETDFTVSSISNILTSVCEAENIKMGNLYPTLRYALTGTFVGAAIPETIHVLGKDKSILRLNQVYLQNKE